MTSSVEIGEGDQLGGELVGLVVAVVEILVESLQREAIRRMESGDLSDEEVERVGQRLAALEAEVEALKEREGVDEEVDRLRDQLDGLVGDALHRVDEPDRPATAGEGRQ